MEIVYKKIGELIPYENNPRKNEEAVRYVANSIREFGWKQPIVVDSDGIIIVGHTRYKAAQELGLEAVPVLVASDLNEEQARAYRLADNKTGEMAGWDFTGLAMEMAKIDMDMSEFGFEEAMDDSVLDDLFTEAPDKEKEPKKVRCPHCGEWFEL